jgi:transcriptional regulator with XRE-family HTH domain
MSESADLEAKRPSFALAFAARRQELGPSRLEVALRAGVAQEFISRIENGLVNPCHTPDKYRLAAALEWSLEQLEAICRHKLAPKVRLASSNPLARPLRWIPGLGVVKEMGNQDGLAYEESRRYRRLLQALRWNPEELEAY